MVHHSQEQTRECVSRRNVLRGVVGTLLTLGLEGCNQPLSRLSTPTPIPTTRPQGSVLYSYRGHRSRVTTVAWSPNGIYIASGSLDKTVHVVMLLACKVWHGPQMGVALSQVLSTKPYRCGML